MKRIAHQIHAEIYGSAVPCSGSCSLHFQRMKNMPRNATACWDNWSIRDARWRSIRSKEIIARIKERAASGNLNRGLRLSLPYFDDQELRIDISNFEIIPSGRIMFVPAFVVRAVRQEEVKVSQDTRLQPVHPQTSASFA